MPTPALRARDSSRPLRLRVGVVVPLPSLGSPSLVVMEPSIGTLCDELHPYLGLEVTSRAYPDYLALLEAISDGDADIAWLPPMVAIRSLSQGSSIPIAFPIRNGTRWFASALFCHASAPFQSIHDLRGTRAAWVDRQSASGYLVMRAWLRAEGVDPASVFASETFCGSHDGVVAAVEQGSADVGATFAHLDPKGGWVDSAGWGARPMRPLTVAGPIPSDVIASSVRLPVPVSRRIRDALVGDASPRVHAAFARVMDAEGFFAAESDHLSGLMRLLQHLDGFVRPRISIPPPPRT